MKHARGFTLTELAVVMVIIGFLVVSGIVALNAQVEQRNYDETQRRLNAAVDAVLAYAVVNRRLPCPAVTGATGVEARSDGTVAAGGNCTTSYGGFLPAETLGFAYVDASRYGVDAYNNRIRYAVASNITGCSGPSALPHFTSVANLKANGVSCRPSGLEVCTSAACAARVVSTETAAFIVFSTGKNGAFAGSQGDDEVENTNGNGTFVSRTPGTTDAAAFDDIMAVVPVGVLYARLIAAGVLP
ncbi:MAG TPA: type II secretion system protein [Burkholderiales bacterium]|jgi:prepilin-type N-terminal cleavage/methylation domain-containing protein|nr:type II secretion system protein [Burkholderiales bacterium]